MELLFTIDDADYNDDMPVFEKHTVRAIIRKDNRIAVQKSRNNEYKLPGGGVEGDESHFDTLKREVAEEMGMLVIPESIKEIGEIIELREDLLSPGTKYVCHSYFYFCDVSDSRVPLKMTESEINCGFVPCWVTPEEMVDGNSQLEDLTRKKLCRDTAFVERILKNSF